MAIGILMFRIIYAASQKIQKEYNWDDEREFVFGTLGLTIFMSFWWMGFLIAATRFITGYAVAIWYNAM